MIDVPLGAHLTLKALVDRPLKDGIRIGQVGQVREAGVVVPDNSVTLSKDGLGFTVRFDKVDKTMDFQFEFHDEDMVKGKRRIRIRPLDDQSRQGRPGRRAAAPGAGSPCRRRGAGR